VASEDNRSGSVPYSTNRASLPRSFFCELSSRNSVHGIVLTDVTRPVLVAPYAINATTRLPPSNFASIATKGPKKGRVRSGVFIVNAPDPSDPCHLKFPDP